MSATMQGRAVQYMRDLAQPGDYTVLFDERGAPKSVWFILPDGTQGRIAAAGHGVPDAKGNPEPEWDVKVSGYDGSVTVSPSIHDAPDGWHGSLERGVWRSA